jgi:hypothetical protein
MNYEHQGIEPSPETAARMRRALCEHGENRLANYMRQSRLSLTKIAARLPVREATLMLAKSRLDELEQDEQARAVTIEATAA